MLIYKRHQQNCTSKYSRQKQQPMVCLWCSIQLRKLRHCFWFEWERCSLSKQETQLQMPSLRCNSNFLIALSYFAESLLNHLKGRYCHWDMTLTIFTTNNLSLTIELQNKCQWNPARKQPLKCWMKCRYMGLNCKLLKGYSVVRLLIFKQQSYKMEKLGSRLVFISSLDFLQLLFCSLNWLFAIEFFINYETL